jgi:hypothetical protein
VWAFHLRRKQNGEWKLTKIPYVALPNGVRRQAESDNPETWRTLEEAQRAYGNGSGFFTGIGFMFKNSGMSGADYDHVLTDGHDVPLWADKIMSEFPPTYTEYSVGGEGLHSLVENTFTGPGINERFSGKSGFEFYCDGRFFCVTGKPYLNSPSTIAEFDSQDFYDRFKRGEFGPEEFRKQKEAEPEEDPDGPKRHEDVESFFEEHKVPHGKPRKTPKFTSWDVECPDPQCKAKNAYVMQHNDGGAGMGCYHKTCAYSKHLLENGSYDKWNKFKAYWKAKRAEGPANGKASSSIFDGPTPAKFNWPEPLAEEAFYGPAGELVRLVEPHTEADPAALLTQFLAGFGSLVGRHAYFKTDGARQYANLYVVIVGRTAKSRRGTSWNQTLRILGQVDADWVRERVMSGTSTGEGIIWAVRDAIKERHPVKQKGRVVGYDDVESDPGIKDKRLLIFEAEYARVLKAGERTGNTIFEVLRDAFDKDCLNILTKKQAARSTGCHVGFVTHVTSDELRRLLTDTSAANGYANRHLFVCSRRSRLLPEGGRLDEVDFTDVIERLQKAAEFARTCGEMKRDDEAKAIWREVYQDLSEGKPGMFGAMIARFDAIVVRLSVTYALLDKSPLIKAAHLNAALAVVKYCEASARFIFGDAVGDETADEILRQLRSRPDGMTRAELRDFFQRNKTSAEISRALGVLQEYGLARVDRQRESEDGLNLTERWRAITVSEAK